MALNTVGWLVVVLGIVDSTIGFNSAFVTRSRKQTLEDATYWNELAGNSIKAAVNLKPNNKIARNVILFLGDGLSIPTLVAARIYKGQQRGLLGEEEYLAFEKFPNVALMKTYNVDRQVPDSAATATAFLCGVKGNYETIGLDATANHSDCKTVENAKVKSIVDWAQESGRATGIVTTTTVTHATPAGAYAHTPNRNWESDADLPRENSLCKDIASQLVEDVPGKNLNVIFGGGRHHFYTQNSTELPEGKRKDGRSLVNEWINDKQMRNSSFKYLTTSGDLEGLKAEEVDYVLGLFSNHHVDYEYIRKKGPEGQPSLKDMTIKAIEVLKKNKKGFFLLVEGGRIDHAHHDGYARRALEETLAMEEAVKAALKLLDLSESLIVVTADHAHVMTVSGYPVRGNNILGFADISDIDNMPYTTLMYSNGPGFNYTDSGDRFNLTNENTSHWDFKQLAAVPLIDESHGGDDVAVYAQGPMAHLFHGLQEQNYVAHVMAYAACIGPYANDCPRPNSASIHFGWKYTTSFVILHLILIIILSV